MADYVLIHGGNMSTDTWNKLSSGAPVHTADGRMGGLIWSSVTPALQAQGHRTFSPTLKDEHKSDLTGHIQQVRELVMGNDLKDIILVGHSYGGMVITGTAAKMADRIVHMVYIDAALPDPGRSLFDIIRSGGRDPLSFPGLEADAPYVEQLQFDPEKLVSLPKIYVRCTKSDFRIVTDAAKKKIDAEKDGWEYLELPSSHVPMAEMPERLIPLLLKTAEK
jgi:pimeloyl-ACP methyl ester carboxylesterase